MFNVGSVQGYLKLNTTGWVSGMGIANSSIMRLTRTFAKMGAVAVGSLLLIEREFGRFDKAIRHATSVSETSIKQFEQMSDMALDASVKWNKAAKATAQAFYFLGSAGLSVTEQMEAFNTTIMLSRAMGSELSRTVEGTVDVVRAFGLEFANIDRIADQLTKTVISSNQTFDILTRALSYASSTARLTNNTLAETTAMLGVMANAGIKGSMAGTVLRRAMTNLMAPTGDMAELVYALGLNIYDTTGKMRPFIDIMGQISDALQGTSARYKNLVFETLFGRRAIAGQIVLFNYGSDALRKYADEIENAAGTTEKVAGKQMKAFTEILGQLWQEIRRVAIELGDTLAPAIGKVATRIRADVKDFREYVEANKELIASTLKWVSVVSVAAIVVPAFALLVVGITNQFIQLGVAIAKAGIAMISSPLMWQLGLLAGLLYTLRTTLATDFWKQAWENQIKPFLAVFLEGFTQTITEIMWRFSLIPDAIEAAFSKQSMLNTILYFTKALQQIGLVARIGFAFKRGDIGKALGLQDELRKLNEEMRTLLTGTPEEEGGLGAFGNILFGSKAEMEASLDEFRNSMKIVGAELKYEGREIAINFGKAFKEQVAKDAKAIGGLFEKLITKLPASMQDTIDQLKAMYAEIANIVDIFMQKPSKLAGIQMPALAYREDFKQLFGDYLIYMDELIKAQRALLKIPTIWQTRWISGVRIVINSMDSWWDVFARVNMDIKSGWEDTIGSFINDTMGMARTFENIMENMFNNVLDAFNKFVAQVLASDLWYTLFGKGVALPFGTATFFHGGKVAADSRGTQLPNWGEFMPQKFKPFDPAGSLGQFAGKAAPNVSVIIENNTGDQIKQSASKPTFNGKEYVVNVVLEAYRTDPNVRSILGG